MKKRDSQGKENKVVEERKSNHSLPMALCEQGLLSHNYENTKCGSNQNFNIITL